MSILFNRGLVLAKVEVTFNVDSLPLAATDSVLVSEPDYSVDVTTLERTNLKTSLSQDPVVVARKIANLSMAHEVRGSGDATGATAPQVAPLLLGCGMAETAIAAGTDTIVLDAPVPINFPDGDFTFVKTTGFDGTLPRISTITCTTPGGSGVADFTVSSPASGAQPAINEVGVLMTDATPFELADGTIETAEITPTIGADFAVGDTFVFWLVPPGFLYSPVSQNFDSLTLYTYYDGLLHIMTGSRGTFTVEGAAGSFANFNFEFQGSFVLATDTPTPASPVFEDTLPNQVELAALCASGGQDGECPNLCAQSFTLDIGNNVVIRECINAVDSVEGAIITDRIPVGAFNPETELEATFPFWSNLSTGDRISFGLRVGKTPGNVVSFFMPYAQESDMAYGNRNDIRIYDVNLNFAANTSAGDDEFFIHFS